MRTLSVHGGPGLGSPAQAAPLGLRAAGCGEGSEDITTPRCPLVRSLGGEEIQESNQSGYQCPGERRAPPPPGRWRPAAVLTTRPQSPGRQQQVCWGVSRMVASVTGVGTVGEVWRRKPCAGVGASCPGSGGHPFARRHLALPLCRVGTGGPQHLTCLTLALAWENAPKLNSVQMWKLGRRQHKAMDGGGTNSNGHLVCAGCLFNH